MDSALEFATFSQLMVSAMLFNSGGHSLHKFTAPLILNEVREAFSDLPGFSTINLHTLFLKDNQKAFDEALSRTIDYNLGTGFRVL